MALRTALVIDGNSQGAKEALRDLESSIQRADRAAEKFETTGRAVTASAGQQRAGMQQLSYQLNDVATMFAMGANPMQIFAAQGGQVVQSIGLMRGSAGGLAGFLSGPWGIAVTSAAVVLTPFISKLFETGGALADVETRAHGAIEALRGLAKETTEQKIAEATGQLSRLLEDQQRLQRLIADGGQYSFGRGTWQKQLYEVNQEVLRVQDAINKGNRALREQAERAAVTGRSGAVVSVAARGSSARATGAVSRAGVLSEEARAAEQARKETERYIASIEDEIAKIGLDAQGLRQLEAARAAEAAQTEAQRKRIGDLNAEREHELALEAARQRAGAIGRENESLAGEIASIEREAQALGLVGWERERMLLQLEREAEIRPLVAELAREEATGNEVVAAGLREQIDQLNKKYGLLIQIGGAGSVIAEQQAALDRQLDSYRQLGQAGYGALSDIVLRGEDAIDTMQRLAGSIADAALEALLLGTGPLGGVFGGGGGLLGSLFGGIFGGGGGGPINLLAGTPFGGARATGGPVSPGNFYTVNERSTAPGLFLPLAPGVIEPPGSSNRDGGFGGTTTVRLELSGDLDARIQQVSGPVAVEVVRSSAPTIVETSVAETARRMTRPRM